MSARQNKHVRETRLTMGTPWRWMAALVAGTLALGTALIGAAPAVAAPVYQITASWENGTPTTVKSGDVVTGVWRVNVNDDAPAPANNPVDNVTVTITTQNGHFGSLPSVCKTSGVTPVSSISADGTTLTCNLGTQIEGTAVVLQAPIVAEGATGSQITASGAIGGQTAALSPIDITNAFGMDMRWGVGTPSFSFGNGGYLVDYEWTLSKDLGSEAGPQSVTYKLNIASPQGSAISIDGGCTPFTGPGAADGHPWSGGSHPADQMVPAPTTCSFTQTGATAFQLTITGIDYTPANPPTLDSAGNRLPVDQVALTSGSIWVRVNTASSGSAVLNSDAPTYTSTSGQIAQDDPSNNSESKAWTTPGLYSSGWGRGYTGSGGTTWDDTYRVSAGTTVGQYMDSGMQLHTDRPADRLVGMCTALDTKYVTYAGWSWAQPEAAGIGTTTEYYVGNDPTLDPASASYNPNAFDCGTSTGWTTTQPTDLTTVKAMRITGTQGQFDTVSSSPHITAVVYQKIDANVPAGTDVWSFFSGIVDNPLNNWWNATGCITPTAGSRYPCTTGFRDILHIVTATPAISKTVDRSVIAPGDPATYTLTYSANGAGAIPATVDGYQLVDTLPAGVTYVAGSASPQPTITTNGSGQQVLSWTLNGVTTNADHALTYQAVADDTVTPGASLTNNVDATYGGITKSAAAQVTVATDGYTTTVKTADAPFIPNLKGDGKGNGSWTVTVRSYDPIAQPFTDTIDILPYNGDGRGTSYSGSYTLASVNAPVGATVYYTTTKPASLSDDPADASNGSAGSVAGNTVGWTTTPTPNATAIRVIGGTLNPGDTQKFGVHITTDGAKGGDKFVNVAQGRAGHTGLVMRTSAFMTEADYYSAAIVKEVQDANGNWHNANDAVDYPTFHFGDTVHYRITVTNTGQGTLTNVNIADDKNPTAGDFHVNSLAPGAQESHEYTMTLDPASIGGGSFVNTACGSADVPADSQVAPTINCDPAGINVVGYHVAKSSSPASGTEVHPGDKITYTIDVTQEGTTPADASLSDNLTKVLDDATYNSDVSSDIGSATVTGNTLTWSGTVPVGSVAHITYTVTVKGAQSLGDGSLVNVVTSQGCDDFAACTTNHEVGGFTYSKTSDPASGTDVTVGQTVKYTIQVKQVGAAAQNNVTITDDLSGVLDDATWNGDQTADSGKVTRSGTTLTWNGDLAVGQTVTITYSVKVTAAGNGSLDNAATTNSDAGTCVPAPDGNPDCATTHKAGGFTFSKMSNPASPATVKVGDTIKYTVDVTQFGAAPVPGAVLNDDLSGVLDDASWVGDQAASSGTAAFAGHTLTWTGDLAVGQHVTITYSVKVVGGGDTTIRNAVTSPNPDGACVPAPDGTPGCSTVQKYGGYTFSKTSDPASGKTVKVGDRIDYTVVVTQTGDAPVTAHVNDDLSKVLDDASWVGNQKATTGTVNRNGNTLTWTGDLAVGQSATITYSVTVNGDGDDSLVNVVTSPDKTAACVPAADQNPDCTTTHKVDRGAAALAGTGSDIVGWALGGLGLLIAGLALALIRRRRLS
ncbi:hypothetical protein GCM10027414_27780 [Humibacter ginsengiterrae]